MENPCDYPVGKLMYAPSAFTTNSNQVIDELSLLLTSGRLSEENKALILEHYRAVLKTDTQQGALQVAQQLMISSPEFHTTNRVRKSGDPREAPTSSSGSSTKPYKAIINVFLAGGMDSFYMLSPHSSCSLYKGKSYRCVMHT